MSGLTFPGAQEYVEAIHQELRRLYPAVPPCINYGDESAGDFGIAHFYGLDQTTARTDDFRETFDNDRIPVRYVVCHELGHALSLNATLLRGGNPFTNGLFDEFWAARGFPGTALEANDKAMAMEKVLLNSGYRHWPEENFADAFGAVNSYGQGTLITETYGAYLNEPRLREFYASLKGAFEMLSDEDIDRIARAVATRVLPEVLGKLDAGFNTTLPVLLDRVAAGDKHTGTAAID